ncbi:hypothetical protein ACIRCZ_16750 [Leifsonia sp. NPDC102414]|uniref:hypothetical protein n=1 Tax=Leifsonia sp. NPDC102414 TaxID=3364124 RepID=UPI0037F79C49
MSDTRLHRDPWTLATVVWTAVALVYVTLIPVGNNVILYPLLLSFAVLAAVNIVRRRIRPDRALILPAAIWAVFLLLGIVTAIARDAESWERTLVFFLVWPAVFSVVVVGFDRRVVRTIFLVGAYVSVLIGVLLFFQALAQGGILPFRRFPAWLAGPLRMAGDSDSGMVSLTAAPMPPLLWWGGIWIAAMFCDPRDQYLPPMWLRMLAGSLVITGAFASWRRGIVIVLVVAPILAVIALVALKVRNVKRQNGPRLSVWSFVRLAIVAAFVVVLTLVAQPHLFSMFTSAVRSSSTVVEGPAPSPSPPAQNINDPGPLTVNQDNTLSDEIRKNESHSLLSPRSPADWIVGRGFGATIDRGAFERQIRPWQTELQYHAIFYWTGILGVMLVIAVAVTALLAVRKAFRVEDGLRGSLYVASVGALCVLMANATNPYLQAPGHMWPVFLPLMITSAILVDERRRTTRQVDGEVVGDTAMAVASNPAPTNDRH